MDFECIETWLELTEFRVIGQVLKPQELNLHLGHRDTSLICPHYQGSCTRIQEGRECRIRDLPLLNRPITLRLPVRQFQCTECHYPPVGDK